MDSHDLRLLFAHLRLARESGGLWILIIVIMIDFGVSQSLTDQVCLAFLFQVAFDGFSGAWLLEIDDVRCPCPVLSGRGTPLDQSSE